MLSERAAAREKITHVDTALDTTIKEMSKKRSKSLSGFSNKKIFSNNESGKLDLLVLVDCNGDMQCKF